jgi:hypothetical protein
MKRVRSLALAFAVCGLAAVVADAQTTGGYPITGRYAAPALLPLPEMSGPWTQSAVTPASGVASGSAVQAAPTVTYVTPSTRPSSAISAPTFPHVAYNRAAQEEVPVAAAGIAPPPVPVPVGTPSVASPVVEPMAGEIPHAAPSVYEEAASGGWSGDCGVCMPSCCPTWYGYVGAVFMGRDRANRTWTTYETGNNANQLMFFPNSDWGTGGEVTIGHTWCGSHACDDGCTSCGGGCAEGQMCGGCGGMTPYQHGLEFTYWGISDMDGEDSRRSETDQLSTPIDLGFVDINTPGLPASVFFDNAREHRVRRENDFHNFEVNLVDFSTQYDRTLRFQWLAGARWFRFDEYLQFASVAGGSEFGSNGGLDEAYLDLDVENNLYGFQIGGRADYRVGHRCRLFGGTKLGLFANEIEFDTRLYRGDGAVAVFTSTGNAFDLSADKTDVSFLAQIDFGVGYDITKHLSAIIGYRAVALTGIALADDQVPAFLAAENDWTDIDSSGSMILHGAFVGGEYRW